MPIKKTSWLLLILLIFTAPGVSANPDLYELVKKAVGTPRGSEEWKSVKRGLAEDIETDLDWGDDQDSTIRELMSEHNPQLLRSFLFKQKYYRKFWDRVAEAAVNPSEEKWSRISRSLKKRPNRRRIDWNPQNEMSARTLLRIYNPGLFEEIYGIEARPPLWDVLVATILEKQTLEDLETYIFNNPREVDWKPRLGEGIGEILRVLHPDYYEEYLEVPALVARYFGHIRHIGSGVCGLVMSAKDRQNGERVAIKVLRKETFERNGLTYPPEEIELMQGLNHPNIVRMIEWILTEDAVYLVTELCTGGDLFSSLNKRQSELQARVFMRQIVDGVAYLHEMGIVHRDLKLENLVFDKLGKLKIIDFGLASYYGKNKLIKSCGSPEYAAPEMCLGKEYDGPEVDVWSLGVILFAMVAAQFPFEPYKQADLPLATHHWPDDLKVSPELDSLIAAVFQPAISRITIPFFAMHAWMKRRTLL